MMISVVNLKGGTGKTTTAMALGTAAARAGERVRVLDCDPQGSASMWAMCAADAGDPMPFSVDSANVATVRTAARRAEDETVFVDCPPNGRVVDEAVRESDFVVVPTGTGPADMSKALETAETLEGRGVAHAVLLTGVVANTVSLRDSRQDLEGRDVSCFDAQVPRREALKGFFGNPFGEDLYGYGEVWDELEKAVA